MKQDKTMLLITFYGKDQKRRQFICDGFLYASQVMGKRSYGWTVLSYSTDGKRDLTMNVRGVHPGRA